MDTRAFAAAYHHDVVSKEGSYLTRGWSSSENMLHMSFCSHCSAAFHCILPIAVPHSAHTQYHLQSILPVPSLHVPRLPCQLKGALQAFLQLGPPSPLQLVFIRRGQCLFRLDLIGVPSTLPIYVSTACRDNGLSQEQVHMHR